MLEHGQQRGSTRRRKRRPQACAAGRPRRIASV